MAEVGLEELLGFLPNHSTIPWMSFSSHVLPQAQGRSWWLPSPRGHCGASVTAAFGVQRGGNRAWDTFWGNGNWDCTSTAVPAGGMWEFEVVHRDGSKVRLNSGGGSRNSALIGSDGTKSQDL